MPLARERAGEPLHVPPVSRILISCLTLLVQAVVHDEVGGEARVVRVEQLVRRALAPQPQRVVVLADELDDTLRARMPRNDRRQLAIARCVLRSSSVCIPHHGCMIKMLLFCRTTRKRRMCDAVCLKSPAANDLRHKIVHGCLETIVGSLRSHGAFYEHRSYTFRIMIA